LYALYQMLLFSEILLVIFQNLKRHVTLSTSPLRVFYHSSTSTAQY